VLQVICLWACSWTWNSQFPPLSPSVCPAPKVFFSWAEKVFSYIVRYEYIIHVYPHLQHPCKHSESDQSCCRLLYPWSCDDNGELVLPLPPTSTLDRLCLAIVAVRCFQHVLPFFSPFAIGNNCAEWFIRAVLMFLFFSSFSFFICKKRFYIFSLHIYVLSFCIWVAGTGLKAKLSRCSQLCREPQLFIFILYIYIYVCILFFLL
jgi:hypothetical protein